MLCCISSIPPCTSSLHLFNLPRSLRPHCMHYIQESLCVPASGQPSQQVVRFKSGRSQRLGWGFFTWLLSHGWVSGLRTTTPGRQPPPRTSPPSRSRDLLPPLNTTHLGVAIPLSTARDLALCSKPARSFVTCSLINIMHTAHFVPSVTA